MQGSAQSRVLFGCGVLVILGMIGLGCVISWFGFRELQEAREYPAPKPITYAQLLQLRPDRGWYTVSGGVLELDRGFWEEEAGQAGIRRAFVPLSPAGLFGRQQIDVLIETKDPSVLSVMERRKSSPSPPAGVPGMFFGGGGRSARPVTGRIPSFNRAEVILTRLRSAGISEASRIAPKYVYLAEGEQPSATAGWTFIGIGAALAALFVFVLFNAKRKTPVFRG